MESRDSIEYIQKEHLEIVRLVDKLAGALALAAKSDFASRQQGLAGLRDAWDGLLGIRQHCGSEEGILESDFRHYLDANQYQRLVKEHQNITRLVGGLLRELPFATADSVSDLCPAGEELLERIHEHIAFEEDMLWRVQEKQYEYQ
jgi:hemerythrin-like domain-containing protein